MSEIYDEFKKLSELLPQCDVLLITNKYFNEMELELYHEGKEIPEKIGKAKIIKCDHIGANQNAILISSDAISNNMKGKR